MGNRNKIVALICSRKISHPVAGVGLLLVVLVLCSLVQAKGGTPSASTAELYKPDDGPYTVEAVAQYILHHNQRDKELQLRITYPGEEEQFPVIIFSHGYRGSKDNYQPLIRFWTTHGYVCIQVNHSDSLALPPPRANFEDWAGRVADIVFILDSLERLEEAIPGLNGKVNKNRIGVGGHSYGAHTAQLIGGTTARRAQSFADARVAAPVLISPQGRGELFDETSWNNFTKPMMVITGTNDASRRTGNTWQWRTEPYAFAPPGDKHLVVIKDAYHGFGGITGADNPSPVTGPPNPTHVTYVKVATIAYWDAYLKDEPPARAFLSSDAFESATGGDVRLDHK